MRLRQRIARDGPISVHDYMQACLADGRAGYYTTRQPIGRDGDFVTAPEISQMFGELLGVWAAAVWQSMGEPAVVVAELGPGRGTLMADALRVFGRVPGLLDRITVALVETSPSLRETQRTTLRSSPAPLQWCERIEDLPQGPLIVIANEFIDALPVRQFVREANTWRERCVALSDTGGFVFCAGDPVGPEAVPHLDAPEGEIVETRPALSSLLAALVARAKHAPIAALFVDYGHAESGVGDTLQAVRRHRFADPLAAPGEADLTAHVDFAALKETARALGLCHLWAHAARRVPAQARARAALRAASAKCHARAESGDHVRRGAACRSAADGGFVQDARAAIDRACPAASLRRHLSFRLRAPWSHQTR